MNLALGLAVSIFLGLASIIGMDKQVAVRYQEATEVSPAGDSTATTTSTLEPGASIATMSLDEDRVNVRAGPGTDYAIVGALLAGQQVPALGRSIGGDWVQIALPSAPEGVGWVYAYYVTVNRTLPVVEPPATPTPLVTPTVDQTLAAQFIQEVPPTRLPTFTPPPELVLPIFPTLTPARQVGDGLPVVTVMIGLAAIGLFGTLVSLLRGR